ncbi:hypothetical protein MRX96_044275 [Rhipicephalus microplus]
MAEAHQAVAFSFTVTHEGVNINYDREVLLLVWQSGLRSWKKRVARFLTNLYNGVYPSSYRSLYLLLSIVTGFSLLERDGGLTLRLASVISSQKTAAGASTAVLPRLAASGVDQRGALDSLEPCTEVRSQSTIPLQGMDVREQRQWQQGVLADTAMVLCCEAAQGPGSTVIQLPVHTAQTTTAIAGRHHAPLPEICEAAARRGKLQAHGSPGGGVPRWHCHQVAEIPAAKVLVGGQLRVRLVGRVRLPCEAAAPSWSTSNFYAIDAIMVKMSSNQAARAANLVYASMLFRRGIDTQQMSPIMVQGIVPLCSRQYERQFNTTRVPGVETDRLVHYQDSQHVAVYHRGRFFKLFVYHKHRLLQPCDLQRQIQRILDHTGEPQRGEAHLGVLTAGERSQWAHLRETHFRKGLNRISLDAIEKAAFVLVLDEDEYGYDPTNPNELNRYARALLHGRGYDRWFDKSFNLIVGRNGRVGFNAEHSWADAPIMGHYWEYVLAQDFFILKYDENGNTRGHSSLELPTPIRLRWDLSQDLIEKIEEGLLCAQTLLDDVDLHLLTHTAYGKGFMKRCRCSPDAYLQMALQLAYYRDAGRFSLTYEASMTRLFREGRNGNGAAGDVRVSGLGAGHAGPECNAAGEAGQARQRLQATPKRIPRRHVRQGHRSAPLLPTPHNQTSLLDLSKFPNFISAGGGFGPVADDGYGVSYLIAGEDHLFFHVSSKRSSPETDSLRFANHIEQSLKDMKALFE